jgi:hypothetical protein
MILLEERLQITRKRRVFAVDRLQNAERSSEARLTRRPLVLPFETECRDDRQRRVDAGTDAAGKRQQK